MTFIFSASHQLPTVATIWRKKRFSLILASQRSKKRCLYLDRATIWTGPLFGGGVYSVYSGVLRIATVLYSALQYYIVLPITLFLGALGWCSF